MEIKFKHLLGSDMEKSEIYYGIAYQLSGLSDALLVYENETVNDEKVGNLRKIFCKIIELSGLGLKMLDDQQTWIDPKKYP